MQHNSNGQKGPRANPLRSGRHSVESSWPLDKLGTRPASGFGSRVPAACQDPHQRAPFRALCTVPEYLLYRARYEILRPCLISAPATRTRSPIFFPYSPDLFPASLPLFACWRSVFLFKLPSVLCLVLLFCLSCLSTARLVRRGGI
jgi:hypothetical protein